MVQLTVPPKVLQVVVFGILANAALERAEARDLGSSIEDGGALVLAGTALMDFLR